MFGGNAFGWPPFAGELEYFLGVPGFTSGLVLAGDAAEASARAGSRSGGRSVAGSAAGGDAVAQAASTIRGVPAFGAESIKKRAGS